MFEIEPALLGADLLVRAFEHREIEVFLVADVVIEHALVGAGLRRDAVDPRAGNAVGGEFLLGSLEDAQPHALGVALPFQYSLCLGQIGRSMMRDDGCLTRLSPFAKSTRAAGYYSAVASFGAGCTRSVGTPQVPLRTVITRVPGLSIRGWNG